MRLPSVTTPQCAPPFSKGASDSPCTTVASCSRTEGWPPPSVLLHDTTVVQGLSEAPFEKGGAHWGVVTLGSRIGNARFTNVTITD